jgi:catecholate siderophore receptor
MKLRLVSFSTAIVAAAMAGVSTSPLLARPEPGDIAAAALRWPSAQAVQATPASDTVRFNIPAGILGDALTAFEAATGFRVTLADDSIRRLRSPAVSGQFTPREALTRLLANTSVEFTFTTASVVRLEIRRAESVTVTAGAPEPVSPKYTEPLRDTPQTVVVIPETVLEEQAATSLRDALRNTPGITMMAGEGGNAPGDNLLIRGFSARNDVYVDGARDSGVSSRDTFATEAIEVAKGPSSVTTGRGATGGSVNLVTKSAGLTNFADARVTGGSAGYKRGTLDVNRTLNDSMAFRMNALWQDAGVPRRDVVRNRAWGFAPSLAIGLGTPTDVTINYQHLQQDNIPGYGLPGTLPTLAINQGVTVKDIDFSNFYGLPGRDFEKTRADFGTVTVNHRFTPRTSLRNLTRYGQNDLDRVVTPPRAATAAASAADPGFNATVAQVRRTDTKYQFRTDKSFVNQTDLTTAVDTGKLRHDVVAGMELSHERQPSYAMTDAFSNGRPPVTDLFNPQPADPYAPALVRTGASTDGRSNSAGLYVFDTIKTGEKWQTNVGLRWDRMTAKYDNVATNGTVSTFERTDQAPSGRAGVVFKPVARGSVYAAYSTSFNPSFDGNFGVTLTAPLANLPPERTHNVEFGTKWDVRPNLGFTFAAFRMNKANAKTTDAAGATVLAGDQLVTGVELGLSGNLTDRWTIFSGVSVMNGQVRESGVAAEVDKQLAYVPKTSLNIWSTYHLPASRLTFGGGAQFTDGYFFNNTNALTSENLAAMRDLTKYWLFSAMVSFDAGRHVSLQVNATNLANAKYVERGYTGHFIPGPGRSLLIGPAFKF